ncbi:lysophospholipid acyltransferase family protein [Thiofilum flexile]|uniref:lysophospholipid acyltransferase family protein n=1 Tax=Thiofilum flexile TaxID=125627 RepID=UPI00036A149D|nr:lysophospholipid acyltransferase family protein [Thiofilum flexile]
MLKLLFFILIVRPFLLLVTGVHIQGRNNLSTTESSILVANHNSHLDTLILMSLYPLNQLSKVRPIAAADYFLKNKWLAWFSLTVLGIIPLKRQDNADRSQLFTDIKAALNQGHSVIIFPEGSRGEANTLAPFKSGIAHLAKDFPQTPVIPIYMHGTGKVLPKGEKLLVPFGIDVMIGKPLYYTAQTTKSDFMQHLEQSIRGLQQSLLGI